MLLFSAPKFNADTICNLNDGRKFETQLSKKIWTGKKIQNLLQQTRSEFSLPIKNTDNLNTTKSPTTWMNCERMFQKLPPDQYSKEYNNEQQQNFPSHMANFWSDTKLVK